MNPLLFTDGYKLDHRRQYPEHTELVYANWTPRKSRIPGIDRVVFFGLQYFIKKYLIEDFEQYFFQQPKAAVLDHYTRRINTYLGDHRIDMAHLAALHDLGYLPLVIKALPDGSAVPIRVPMFTMYNTLPEFFWLTNYFETLVSLTVWLPCTSATLALRYRHILDKAAATSSSVPDFVDWQGHDFSMRGMGGLEAAMLSGAGHLTSFTGTDTVPAIDFLEHYYNADATRELVGGSVAATEHSVMSMGTHAGEHATFKRLLTDVYPSGVVSIVSDTWDLWKVLTDYLPSLKDTILARDGKVVIRPDSGDPVDIICGCPDAPEAAARRGVVELLWETFGGTTNAKGYRELDPHVGAIYGDSITPDRATRICERLMAKGFASTNVVFGIGSFTYQYNTRDTFGFAMKATYGEVGGEARAIYKDPVTDDGTKTSARGLLRVDVEGGTFVLRDGVGWAEERGGALREVYRDGRLLVDHSLAEVRATVKAQVTAPAAAS